MFSIKVKRKKLMCSHKNKICVNIDLKKKKKRLFIRKKVDLKRENGPFMCIFTLDF